MQDGIIDEKKLAAVKGKLHAVDAVGKCAVIDPKQLHLLVPVNRNMVP